MVGDFEDVEDVGDGEPDGKGVELCQSGVVQRVQSERCGICISRWRRDGIDMRKRVVQLVGVPYVVGGKEAHAQPLVLFDFKLVANLRRYSNMPFGRGAGTLDFFGSIRHGAQFGFVGNGDVKVGIICRGIEFGDVRFCRRPDDGTRLETDSGNERAVLECRHDRDGNRDVVVYFADGAIDGVVNEVVEMVGGRELVLDGDFPAALCPRYFQSGAGTNPEFGIVYGEETGVVAFNAHRSAPEGVRRQTNRHRHGAVAPRL